MLRQFVSSLVLLAAITTAVGCDESAEASIYVDGQSERTENGAFNATLSHVDGAPNWGMNSFYLRVAMPNPNDASDDGRGIPNLDIDLAAWMSAEDHEMDSVPTVTYEGDGMYRIDGVMLDAVGSWTLDFQITTGELVESARFAFALEA